MRLRRHRRRQEEGLSLLEILITLFLILVGIVQVVAGFSTIERQLGSTFDDAQLVTLARQITQLIETEPTGLNGAGQGGLRYVICSSSAGSGYVSQLTAAGILGGDTVSLNVMQANGSSSSHVVNGASHPLTAINVCGGAGQSSTPDYGVQQITFTLSTPQRNSIARTVYKRWN